MSEACHQLVETPAAGDYLRWQSAPLAAARRLTRSSASAHPSASACGRQWASSESSISRTGIDTGPPGRSAGRPSRLGRPRSGSRREPQGSAPLMRALPRARDEPATGSTRPGERPPRQLTGRPSPAPRPSRAPAAAARPTTRRSDRVSPLGRSARRPPRRSQRSRRRTGAGLSAETPGRSRCARTRSRNRAPARTESWPTEQAEPGSCGADR